MINPTFIGDDDVIGGTYEMDDLPPEEEPEEEPNPEEEPDDTEEDPDEIPTPGTPETSRQRLTIKRDKISALLKHIGLPDADPNLANLDFFEISLDKKTGVVMLKFSKMVIG